MSQNEIKPVTRYELDTDGEGYSFGDAIPVCREHPEGEWVAYAEHCWAIDRLREDLAEIRSQRDRAELLVEARGTCIDRLTAEREVLLRRLATERAYVKKMDGVIDELGVANSCINPYEDLKIAISRLKEERDAAVAERGRYFCDGPEGHFFCDDLELARGLVNAYDKHDDWTITDMLNPYGAGK